MFEVNITIIGMLLQKLTWRSKDTNYYSAYVLINMW